MRVWWRVMWSVAGSGSRQSDPICILPSVSQPRLIPTIVSPSHSPAINRPLVLGSCQSGRFHCHNATVTVPPAAYHPPSVRGRCQCGQALTSLSRHRPGDASGTPGATVRLVEQPPRTNDTSQTFPRLLFEEESHSIRIPEKK